MADASWAVARDIGRAVMDEANRFAGRAVEPGQQAPHDLQITVLVASPHRPSDEIGQLDQSRRTRVDEDRHVRE
jgi:hypothetical protein